MGFKAVGAALALLGAYAAWVSLQPNIIVTVEQPTNDENEASPLFLVRNTGYSIAKDVTFECAHVGLYNRQPDAVWSKEWQDARPRPKGAEYEDIGDMAPNYETVRKCVVLAPPGGFTASEGSMLIPIVTFRWWLSPWRNSKNFFFESVRSQADLMTWQYRGNGLSKSQAKRLNERGHETMELNAVSQKLEIHGPGNAIDTR